MGPIIILIFLYFFKFSGSLTIFLVKNILYINTVYFKFLKLSQEKLRGALACIPHLSCVRLRGWGLWRGKSTESELYPGTSYETMPGRAYIISHYRAAVGAQLYFARGTFCGSDTVPPSDTRASQMGSKGDLIVMASCSPGG